MTGRPFFVLALAAALACASAGAPGTAVNRDPNLITEQEIADGQYFGELSSLRNIAATQIHEVRYLSGLDAVSRYGMRYGSGAVDVRSK